MKNKPLLIQISTAASKKTEPFAWQAAGMGYLIRSDNGEWIIIDGGHTADAETVVELLKAHSDGVPHIRYWIITHAHRDHYGAPLATAQSDALKEQIKVDAFLSCLPEDDFMDTGRNKPCREYIVEAKRIPAAFGCRDIRAAKGDVYEVGGMRIEILLTYDDIQAPRDPNETSLMLRVCVGGQSIMFCADQYRAPCELAADIYGESLKSDFCQLAHHALNGGSERLYELVAPKACLLPMSRPALYAVLEQSPVCKGLAEKHRKLILATPEHLRFLSADGHVIIELPYSF